MSKELRMLIIATFLVGTALSSLSRLPEVIGMTTPRGNRLTSSAAAPAGDIRCVCTCGINCDGSCAYDTGSCIVVQDAINCVANCCARAPKPGSGECGGPGEILP
jgi:hypothetical protein